jgi:hypothetical protein
LNSALSKIALTNPTNTVDEAGIDTKSDKKVGEVVEIVKVVEVVEVVE